MTKTNTDIAKAWDISPQLYAMKWRDDPRTPELLKLDPKEYVKLGKRWGATGLLVATWPQNRLDMLKKGSAVVHNRPEKFDMAFECHNRGFTQSELAAYGEWSANSLRDWAAGREQLRTRLWDAILGMEVVRYGN